MIENRNILRTRMENLHAVLVGENGDERREIMDRKRIDKRGDLPIVQLQQAELRVVGFLAHELGIDGEQFRAFELACQLLELRLRRHVLTQPNPPRALHYQIWRARAHDAASS